MANLSTNNNYQQRAFADFGDVVASQPPHEKVHLCKCVVSSSNFTGFGSLRLTPSKEVLFHFTSEAGFKISIPFNTYKPVKVKELARLNKELSRLSFAVMEPESRLSKFIVCANSPFYIPPSWIGPKVIKKEERSSGRPVLSIEEIFSPNRSEPPQIYFRTTYPSTIICVRDSSETKIGRICDFNALLRLGVKGTIANPVMDYGFRQFYKDIGLKSVSILMPDNKGKIVSREINCLENHSISIPICKPSEDIWREYANELAPLCGLKNLPANYWRNFMEAIFLDQLVAKLSDIIPEPTDNEKAIIATEAKPHESKARGIWGQCYDGPREAGGTLPIGHFAIFTCKSKQTKTEFYIVDSPLYGVALRIYSNIDDAISYCRGGEFRKAVRNKSLARIFHDPNGFWRTNLRERIQSLFDAPRLPPPPAL